jgi:ketosteroid isomerase-like protein
VLDWLFEGRSEVYWLLGVLAVLLLIVWWYRRNRGLLIAAGVMAALGGLYFLLSLMLETPRAQIERKLKEMAAAVKAKDADALFNHIAADFRFRGQDRKSFRTYVDTAFKGGMIDDLIIYDFDWREDKGGDRVRNVAFMAKPKASYAENQPAYRVQAKFVREADGQWRMQSFEVYNPVLGQQPMDIPNLP